MGLNVGIRLHQEYGNIGQREHDRLTTQAAIVAKDIERSLDVINRVLLGIREGLPDWRKNEGGMLLANQRLTAFVDAMRNVRTLLVLDADGNAIATNQSQVLGMNFSQRAYFQAARTQPDANTLYVSPPFKSALDVWVMNVAHVVLGPKGEFAGIVSATLDPEELGVALGSVLYGQDMWAALAHADGLQVLMEPDRPGQAGKNLAQPGSFFTRHRESGKSAEVLEGIVAATGEYRMIALQNVQPASLNMDKPLVVAVGREMGALYAPWKQRAWREGGGVALLACIGILGLHFSQRRRLRIEAESAAAAEALAESERFMRVLIDNLPGMVAYWDADLHCGFANQAYLQRFGKTEAEMRNIPIESLQSGALFRENEKYIRAVLAGEPQHFERCSPRPDGSVGHSWVHYIPDEKTGRVVGFFVLISDVSEIKQTQTQLLEANEALEKRTVEAEAASLAKSSFVANMSHEIRTPMNAVIGLLQLMHFTRLDARQRDYVSKAEGAAQSLLGILNDILDFSKVEAGKLMLDEQPFRLDNLLRNLSVMLSSALHTKDVEILFQIDQGLPRGLRGDGLRLQQILLNLAGNAIKFTERGEVVVALKLLQASQDSVRIEFSVRDTGIGIPVDVLPRLFNPFEQADVSTTRRYGGTGLGLVICQRMVQLMGGELSVESVPGQGSSFQFAADFKRDGELVDEVGTVNLVGDQQGLRILIVDDNATARGVLLGMAASFGWQAEAAAGGEQAIECLEAAEAAGEPFDILCVDWIMPGMDGWEAVRRIRERRGPHLPAILMITAHGRELIEERLLVQPKMLDGFLVKPVTPSMLFDAVAQITHGESASTPADSPVRFDSQLAGLRILLVEDHPLNQQVAQELLVHAGAHVEVAANGMEGIRSIEGALLPFDVILMDIQMPGMDGYRATQVLRQEMGVTTPIIAMTANALAADREACLAAGMNDHIGKPVDLSRLIASLRRHCPDFAQRMGDSRVDYQLSAGGHQLPQLPGFDLSGALERMGGSQETLAGALRCFVAERELTPAAIREALAEGDVVQASSLLHTLKGVAATVGAEALAQLCAESENLLKTDLQMEHHPWLAALDESYTQAVSVFREVSNDMASSSTAASSQPLDTMLARELLSELARLLATNNMRAVELHERLKTDCTALGGRLYLLNAAMMRLDFPVARQVVKTLMDQLPA